MNNKQTANVIQFRARNFHGAAIIDENGKEIPITEKMINEAISQMIDYLPHWTNPLSVNKQ
jgi:hypothetical protein